jgi:uncharacterized protein (TIGR03435 family)
MPKPILVLCFASTLAIAQDKPPSFEVASIKPADRPVAGATASCANIGVPDPGRFTARYRNLKALIQCAYSIEDFRISGGDESLMKGRYEIDAKPSNPATKHEMLIMLQTLLADRFQLSFHMETKPAEVTVLSVSKDGSKFGPQFHPFKEGEPPAITAAKQRKYGPISIKAWATGLRLNMQYSVPGAAAPANIPPILDRTGLDGPL